MEMTISRYRPQVQQRTTRAMKNFRDLYRRNAYLWNERVATTSRRIELAERGLAIAEILLGLRFIFQLFGASMWNPIVAIDYIVTLPFVIPFYGLFGLNPSSGLLRPQLESLSAMIIWAVVTWGAIGFTRMRNRRLEMEY